MQARVLTAVPGTTAAAELLEVRDGVLVRAEVIYDAEELRKAAASGRV